MCMSHGITVCYQMNGQKYKINDSNEMIKMTPFIREGQETKEVSVKLENCSGEDIYLEYVTLWESEEAEELLVGNAPFEVYRSGRHKNDMPGTFTLGEKDARIKDVLGEMSESGDRTEASDGMRNLVSDHLTVISGSEGSLLIEFMGGREQLFETVLALDDKYEFGKISANVIFRILLPDKACVNSEPLKLVWTEDVEAEVELFAEEKAQKYGSRSGKRPSVFCTWYYYGLTVTYEDVRTNLDIMKQKKLPFDVFQVDEGWEVTLGEWRPNHKFPVPMEQVAKEIREAGYIPGIWTSPFIAHETATIWEKHPEWMLKDMEGNPYLFPMNDTVYYVFDITNPTTYDYFESLYRMLTFEWGYPYHKLDFTRAAVIYEDADFYDKTVTLAQAYYRAVCAIRKGMGEEAYFLMCGGLYDPIIGIVDAQRTGSDVLSMWNSTVNKNGKTAPYTIKQSVYRYYMNRWWDNDPDALMIRKNETMERNLRLTYGLLNDEEVKTSVMNQFMGGGIMCTTEPLDKISDDRLMEYRRILPVVKSKVRPLQLMAKTRFPGMADVYLEKENAHCLCLINWEDEEKLQPEICIRELLPAYAKEDCEYLVCDYYSGTYWSHVSVDDKIYPEPILPHGGNVYKIMPMPKKPVIISSTGHYSMGGELEVLELQGTKLHYIVNNPFAYPITYKVLMPDENIVVLHAEQGRQEGWYEQRV